MTITTFIPGTLAASLAADLAADHNTPACGRHRLGTDLGCAACTGWHVSRKLVSELAGDDDARLVYMLRTLAEQPELRHYFPQGRPAVAAPAAIPGLVLLAVAACTALRRFDFLDAGCFEQLAEQVRAHTGFLTPVEECAVLETVELLTLDAAA